MDLSGTTSDFKRPKPDPLLDFKSFNALPEDQKSISKQEKKSTFKSPVKISPTKTPLTKSLKVESTSKKSDPPTSPFNLKDTQSPIRPQGVLGKSDIKVTPSKNAQSMKTPSKSPTKSMFKSSVTSSITKTRINEEKTSSQKISEMMKVSPKKEKGDMAIGKKPQTYFSSDLREEELRETKKKVKALIVKPRKNWTAQEQEFFHAANQPEMKELLKNIK